MTDTPRTDRFLRDFTMSRYATIEDLRQDREARFLEWARTLERENRRLRNGFANLNKALEEAPGLPIELLSAEEQEAWTDILSGILMALGVLETTGRPMSPFEALIEAAGEAKTPSPE